MYGPFNTGEVIPFISNGVSYNLSYRPYETEVEIDEVKIPMTFYDGYALSNHNDVLILYPTIKELIENPETDFDALDMFHDRYINFLQIQYIYMKETIKDKERIANYLSTINATEL